jgi:carboxymethylenebutenolidase
MIMSSPVRPSPEGVPGAIVDPACVRGEDVLFPGAHDDAIGGYLAAPAVPAGEHGRPGVLVIHHAGGVDAHIRDVTNRIANLGYVALAVDLFTREGGPPPLEDLQALMSRLFAMSDQTVLADLQGAADLLRTREDCDGKVGCIGFCMGGRYALLLACASNRLDAAVDCWGGFIDAATLQERSSTERPTPPLELAERLSCPLLAAFGAEDHNPSPLLAKQLLARAQASGQEVRVDVYEGAGHAFFADHRPTYRPQPAALLWERVGHFLERHLKGARDGA